MILVSSRVTPVRLVLLAGAALRAARSEHGPDVTGTPRALSSTSRRTVRPCSTVSSLAHARPRRIPLAAPWRERDHLRRHLIPEHGAPDSLRQGDPGRRARRCRARSRPRALLSWGPVRCAKRHFLLGPLLPLSRRHLGTGLDGGRKLRSWHRWLDEGRRWRRGDDGRPSAPGWMRGQSLPGALGADSTDPGSVMGDLFASAPGARVSPAEAKRLADKTPTSATADRVADRLAFATRSVRLIVLASPAMPRKSFRIAGITNPSVVVPAGSQVGIEFINADADMAHGLVVTASGAGSSWAPMTTATTVFPGAARWLLGEATSAGTHAGTVFFTAPTPRSYQYLWPVPGHAEEGMVGRFLVAAASRGGSTVPKRPPTAGSRGSGVPHAAGPRRLGGGTNPAGSSRWTAEKAVTHRPSARERARAARQAQRRRIRAGVAAVIAIAGFAGVFGVRLSNGRRAKKLGTPGAAVAGRKQDAGGATHRARGHENLAGRGRRGLRHDGEADPAGACPSSEPCTTSNTPRVDHVPTLASPSRSPRGARLRGAPERRRQHRVALGRPDSVSADVVSDRDLVLGLSATRQHPGRPAAPALRRRLPLEPTLHARVRRRVHRRCGQDAPSGSPCARRDYPLVSRSRPLAPRDAPPRCGARAAVAPGCCSRRSNGRRRHDGG